MHTIELLFGISPDGGNGSLEFTIFTLLFVLAFLIFRRRKTSRKNSVPAI